MAGPKKGTDQNTNSNTNNETEEQRTRARRRELSNYQQSALMQDRIAAVQRHVEARQNAPQQAPAPKKKTSAWGDIKHGLFTALSAVAAATVGGFFWLISSPYTSVRNYYRQAKKVKTKSDTNIIPGTKTEKFQDPDVDGGREDQDIIDDVRRVPLVFEREIFDNPNQGPTITLHFKQAKEGSSVAFSSMLQAGHAFLTLKYTKKDPLTGKDKRYQTTVGFGAQTDPLTGGSELLNGMFVPGILNDDFGSAADVSKEYPITNKALNKVILAAQKYETGGYQLMKRNCTTFVAEMAREAGLQQEVQQFMKELDFKLEESPILPMAVPLVLVGGPTATAVGRYAAYKDIGKKTYKYSRFGQDLYSKDEIRRIDEMELNARLYGYDPSASGEALRNMPGTGLNSTAYGNQILWADVPKNRGLDSNDKILQFRFQTMMNAMSSAKRSLQAVLEKKCPGFPENANLIQFLDETTETLRQSIDRLYTPEMLNHPKQRRDHYIDIWRELAQKMNTLNEYYINNYQGNTEVNVQFQRMSAVFANMQTLILRCEELQKNNIQTYDEAALHGEYIDLSRDSSAALRNWIFSKREFDLPQKVRLAHPNDGNYFTVKVPMAELIASPKVFGNIEDCVRYYILQRTPNKTKEETKEFVRLAKRYPAMRQFVKAQTGYAGKRTFTLQDYKYAFVDLPQAEKSSSLNFKDFHYSPAALCQSVALERIFGGLKSKLIEEMKNPACTQESVYTVLCNHMAEKIRENRKEYSTLVKCLYLDEVRNHKKFDRSKDELNFKEYCMEKANDRILEAFQKAYQEPLFKEQDHPGNTLITSAKRQELRLYNMAKQRLQDLPQFRTVREQICRLTGTQPLLSEKRSAAIQTLKDWKEAEVRKEQEAKNPTEIPANGKQKPEVTAEKLKESVETLLKADACYADLISNKKLLRTTGDLVTQDTLDKIDVSIAEKDVKSLAETLLNCCSSKKPLAVSKEELQVVDMMKELKKLGRKESLLEEEPGLNLI